MGASKAEYDAAMHSLNAVLKDNGETPHVPLPYAGPASPGVCGEGLRRLKLLGGSGRELARVLTALGTGSSSEPFFAGSSDSDAMLVDSGSHDAPQPRAAPLSASPPFFEPPPPRSALPLRSVGLQRAAPAPRAAPPSAPFGSTRVAPSLRIESSAPHALAPAARSREKRASASAGVLGANAPRKKKKQKKPKT